MVAHLREQGHSFRAIGNALGVSVGTAHSDVATVQDRTVDVPDRIVGLDGRSRPSRMPAKRKTEKAAQQRIEIGEAPPPETDEDDDGQDTPAAKLESLVRSTLASISFEMAGTDFSGVSATESQIRQIREARSALTRLLKMLTKADAT